MCRRPPEMPAHSAYLVRGSLTDDDLWALVVATVTEPVTLNSSTTVDIEWHIVDGDRWTSWNPITEPGRCGPDTIMIAADKRTAIDDTVVTVTGSRPARRIPIDEAAWEVFIHLIGAGRSDRE